MSTLDNTHGNNLLDGELGTAAYVATTGPLHLRLMTANGSVSANGTEVTGGSYAQQTIAFGAAAGQSTSNTGAISIAGMPACTVVGVELWDSSATPKRKRWGPLTASVTYTAGDTATLAVGDLTVNWI